MSNAPRELTVYHTNNGSDDDGFEHNHDDDAATDAQRAPPLGLGNGTLTSSTSASSNNALLVEDGHDDELFDFQQLTASRQQKMRRQKNCKLAAIVLATCVVVGLMAFLGYTIAAAEAAAASASADKVDELAHTAQWLALAQAYRNASNSSVNPCVDFYQYVCGGMIAHTELEPDEVSRGMFYELREKVDERLLAVAESGWPVVSTWFDTCEDMHARDALSDYYLDQFARALTAAVDNDNSTTAEELLRSLAIMHSLGVRALFDFDAMVDPLNHTRYIYVVTPARLSLPHDMMLGSDEPSQRARTAMLEYVRELFSLAGYDPSEAANVLAYEQQLARNAQPPEAYRDLGAVIEQDVFTLESLNERTATATFDWLVYYELLLMETLGIYVLDNANGTIHADATSAAIVDRWRVQALPLLVLDEHYLNATLANTTLMAPSTLGAYLRYRMLYTFAGDASSAHVDARNRFFDALQGISKTPPLWSQCISSATAALGDLFAHYYVQQFYGGSGVTAVVDALVADIEASMWRRLSANRWMDNATRTAALQKLSAIHAMVGSPERWSPNVGFDVVGSDEGDVHLGNVVRWRQAIVRSNVYVVLAQQTPERYPWLMEAFEVNAYYEPSSNEIALPAGILQGFFFDADAPLSSNYGAMGSVVGHELTHAFDDQGREYDADGNLRDWWTPQSSAEFAQRAQCVVELYDSFQGVDALPDSRVNGELTLGENLADMGGLHVAYDAHEAALARLDDHESREYIEALRRVFGDLAMTPQQLFFRAYAYTWCTKKRTEAAYEALASDPHSPAKWRVNGPLSQMAEFAQDFGCPPPLPADVCQVW